MNENKILGERIQTARQTAGLTQQELCEKAGLSYSTLAKIERGAIASPSVFTVYKIANTIHTNIDTLVGNPAPVLTDKSCFNCGMKMFSYDKAYRCIYCGSYVGIQTLAPTN